MLQNDSKEPFETQGETAPQTLWQEYENLDAKLTRFRRTWNQQAYKDLEYAKVHHVSKGKQADFPEWWYQDVERWKELRRLLRIR